MSFLESIIIQAMIIMAWSESGQPTSIFEDDGFKKVLSLFITAAILKFAQGEDGLFFCPLPHLSNYLSFYYLTNGNYIGEVDGMNINFLKRIFLDLMIHSNHTEHHCGGTNSITHNYASLVNVWSIISWPLAVHRCIIWI